MTTPTRPAPLVYLITDRLQLAQTPARQGDESPTDSLVRLIQTAVDAGVDLIQIRERDLSGRALYRLAEIAVRAAEGSSTRILINDRADIAASLCAGVHLSTRSIAAPILRSTFGTNLLIGASTHNIIELDAAQQGGADFAVFGPVFETASKRDYGPPVGVESLRAAVAKSRIPVIALGGINAMNFRKALETGAAGIAGIGLFMNASDLTLLVWQIKS